MADRLDLEQLRAAMGYGWKDWHYGDPLHDTDIGALDTILGATRFLLSLAESGGHLVAEQPCEHGAWVPHGWVCGEHDTDEKCPRRNCEAYLDFGEHCPQLHRNDDTCWPAWACGGGSRRRVFPKEGER